MSETTETKATETSEKAEKTANSLVDAIFDVGQAWAEYGLGYGKFALENTAKVLQRTAAALADIQARLKSEPTDTKHAA